MAFPAGLKCEIEWTAGTWSDITADVDMSSQITIQYGRTSPYSAPQIASMTGMQLKNTTGKYTPKSQLLIDGVTVNPNYPNVVPRKRIRWSYTISAVQYFFFWGYIQSWPPMVENGIRPYVAITAVDRSSLLAGIKVQNAPIQAMLIDSPVALWPYTDPSGVTSYAEIIGGKTSTVINLLGSASVTSGAVEATPYADSSTGLVAAVDSTVNDFAELLATGVPTPAGMNTAWSFEAWIGFQPDTSTGRYATSSVVMSAAAGTTYVQFFVHNTTATIPGAVFLNYVDPNQSLSSAAYQPTDGTPHLYSAVGTDNGTNLTVQFYVNGVLFDTQTGTTGHGIFGTADSVNVDLGTSVGASVNSGSALYGPVSVYASSLSAARVAQHYYAGVGGGGQTTGQRIVEYLHWAGVATGDQTVATGVQTVTAHSVAGKDIFTLCSDMALTEGGGAAFYQAPNGQVTFLDRHYRSAQTPLMTFDAQNDLDGTQYQPSFDDFTLTNTSTLSRPTGANQTYINAASVSAYGTATDTGQTEVYPDNDGDLLRLAQDRVASQANPAFRVGQLAVELINCITTGLYQLFGAVAVGSRMRVSNLVAGKSAPLATVDVYAEGWTISLFQSSQTASFKVIFDTTPADNPPRGKWDTFRWGPVVGDMLLNAGITAAATALAIKWTIGPQLTTTSGSYPLIIHIDEEDIQLNGVPGGSTSPQSYTGATRGVNGTRAAAHATNAVISLSSVYGNWQL